MKEFFRLKSDSLSTIARKFLFQTGLDGGPGGGVGGGANQNQLKR